MAYLDLTGTFDYKDLLPWTKLAQLAENDAYDVFRSGTVHIFYQASAPTGYTKITGSDDHAIRIVSSSGGSTGGSANLSGTVSLAHTHTIDSHDHSEGAHGHSLNSTNASSKAIIDYGFVSSNFLFTKTGTIGGSAFINYATRNMDDNTATVTGASTGGTTASALTNIQFAYADVILASKDA